MPIYNVSVRLRKLISSKISTLRWLKNQFQRNAYTPRRGKAGKLDWKKNEVKTRILK